MLSSLKSWLSTEESGGTESITTEVNEKTTVKYPQSCEQSCSHLLEGDGSSQNVPEIDIDEELKEVYTTAMNWSNYVLSLGKSATENAVKTVSTTAKHIAERVQDVDHLIDSSGMWTDFNATQQRFIQERPDVMSSDNVSDSNSHALPWLVTADASSQLSLREAILTLSLQENTFLNKPPPDSKFIFELNSGFQQVALAMLHEDPQLDKMRYRLVPGRINEDTFWRNYFYHIHQLQQQVLSNHISIVISSQEPGEQVPASDVQSTCSSASHQSPTVTEKTTSDPVSNPAESHQTNDINPPEEQETTEITEEKEESVEDFDCLDDAEQMLKNEETGDDEVVVVSW